VLRQINVLRRKEGDIFWGGKYKGLQRVGRNRKRLRQGNSEGRNMVASSSDPSVSISPRKLTGKRKMGHVSQLSWGKGTRRVKTIGPSAAYGVEKKTEGEEVGKKTKKKINVGHFLQGRRPQKGRSRKKGNCRSATRLQ